MPIYKASGKKYGLQKYNVRVNYVNDYGKKTSLTRVAWGSEQAKDLEMQLYKNIKNKEIATNKKMTVKQLFDEFISAKEIDVRKTTLVKTTNDFKNYVFPAFENILIDHITVKMLEDWKKELKGKNLAISTIKNAFMNFKALLNYAIIHDYLQKNPFDKIRNFKDTSIKKEMKFYTADEFKKFIDTARKSAEEQEKQNRDLSEWNYYVFFAIAFYTGARRGEIHALKWSDIKGTRVDIRRSLNIRFDIETTTKTGIDRIIQMPKPLINILNEHKERLQRFNNFNDDFRICGVVTNTTMQRKNKQYSTGAGLKTIRIHDFRHSHASLLANSNINIMEIARRLGHSEIEMTWNTYSHLYPQTEDKALEILNAVI